DLEYPFILGILNSTLSNFIYRNITQESGRLFAEVKPKNVRKLFIPKIMPDDQQELIGWVNQVLALKESDPNADIAEMELNINRIVCDLYNLTSEEKQYIESEF
ncbi:MAG: hypothetical protein HN914_11115, partial [Candidatus Marinimicrobia bacterium]|nr:hypothetical protein [Candidatus Neomarinimicrobiota bacterium]